MEFQNTNISELILPTTITLVTKKQDEIIAALKEADIKCSAIGTDNNISITFGVNDIEKLNKLLQPFSVNKQIDDIPLSLPKTEKAENLLPFFNAVSKLFDRKLNAVNSKLDSHRSHIKVLQSAVTETRGTIDKLSSRNTMLKGIRDSVGFLKNPINALVKRNEKKIERLQRKTLPKLEKQIQIHQNTMDKLNQRADKHILRKSICFNLSSVVKSFGISDKDKRSTSYLFAMNGFNNDLISLNNEKIREYKNQIVSQPSREQKLSEKIHVLEVKNKVLQASIDDNISKETIYSSMRDTENILLSGAAYNNSFTQVSDNMALTAAVSLSDKAAKVKAEVLDPIMDKDGDHIPDRIDTNFDPEVNRFNEEEDRKASLQKKGILNEYSKDDFIAIGLLSEEKYDDYNMTVTNKDYLISEYEKEYNDHDQSFSSCDYLFSKDDHFYFYHNSGYTIYGEDNNKYHEITSEKANEFIKAHGTVETYNKPFIKIVSPAELAALRKEGIEFKVNNKKKTKDSIPIMYNKNEKHHVEKTLAAFSLSNKAVRK